MLCYCSLHWLWLLYAFLHVAFKSNGMKQISHNKNLSQDRMRVIVMYCEQNERSRSNIFVVRDMLCSSVKSIYCTSTLNAGSV